MHSNKDWLTSQQQTQAWRLKLAALAGLVASLALMAQFWLLAQVLGPLILGQEWSLTPIYWLPAALGLRLVAQAIKDHLGNSASRLIRSQIRQQLMQRLSMLGLARAQAGADGAIASQVLEQVDAMDAYFSRYYSQKLLVVLVPVVILILMFWLSPLVASIMLLTAPLIPVFMILVGQRAAKANREQFQALSQLGGQFLDNVRGLGHLLLLSAQPQQQERLAQASEEYRSRTMKVLRQAFLSTSVLELFSSIAIALVALYLGLGLLGELPWAKGQVPVPFTAALFILLITPEFYQPLRQLGSDYHAKAQAEGAAEVIMGLYHCPLPAQGSQELQLSSAPSLSCQNLSLAGGGRLKQLSWQLPAGQKLAILGASGSGKSSLLQCLLGYQTPETGELLINQQSLAQLNLDHWRRQIGWLAQQPDWIAGSLADNLRLAKPQASDSELWQALELVGLASLIQQLPQRLNSQLGDQGQGLSGGQKQRLAIARLLLQDKQLWLLDEPAAHLDPQSRAQIRQLLLDQAAGRTLLYVTHDQDLTGFDWVMILQQGRLAYFGPSAQASQALKELAL